MSSFSLQDGSVLVDNLIKAIQDNKQYLSDIDGAIGDGDHGINMNKGFTMCREQLDKEPGDMAQGLKVLSKILMMKIGGSMGPLYGKFFKAIAQVAGENDTIDKDVFAAMIGSARDAIAAISPAKVGDKTLIDTLEPAVATYKASVEAGDDFVTALNKMKAAAREGRDSTKDLVAKLGRASRLGDRSKGVLDAGSVSCCLILETMADAAIELVQ